MSMLSTNSSVNRFSMMSRANNDWQQRAEPTEPPKCWEEDPKNAVNWRLQKKAINTFIAGMFTNHFRPLLATNASTAAIAFAYILSLSIYSAAITQTMTKLKLGSIVAIVPYSAFILGLAFGPALATPFAAAYGRKIVFLCSIPFFGLLMIGAGVSKSIIPLVICRFLSALFASPGLYLTYAMVSDMWATAHQSLAIGLFACAVELGAFAGFVVSVTVDSVRKANSSQTSRWGHHDPISDLAMDRMDSPNLCHHLDVLSNWHVGVAQGNPHPTSQND